jgi:hypothetical protein
MLILDIPQALRFLDALDPGERHTLASEAPFGGKDNGPKWESGATYEARQRDLLIADIRARQERGSNVYYGVNRPCPVGEQRGWNGKCNVDDIIAIRALAFDVDITKRPFDSARLVEFIKREFLGALRPSLLINTGGGFQLIYILEKAIDVALVHADANEKAKADRSAITRLAQDFELLLGKMIPAELREYIKIDNMSNLDRVMRLPGTVNYPKAEKRAKGQVEALAHIVVDYAQKCNIFELRKQVPRVTAAPSIAPKKPFVQRPNSKWPPYRKALTCCEFIRDKGAADTNEVYTKEVMLPLINAAHDGEITIDEAEECFLEAVSGGERYGTMGRGMGYFKRQFRSHLGSRRSGHRTLGTLIWFCKSLGMELPWKDEISWGESFEKQYKELSENRQIVDISDIEIFMENSSVKR